MFIKKKVASLAVLTSLLLGMFTLAFNVQLVKSNDEWIPYVPQAQYVQLYYYMQNGISYINVSITFATGGFNVSDWGVPVLDGTNIWVNTEIWMWTGSVIQIVTIEKHTYCLEVLHLGEYNFTFMAWYCPVKSITFRIIQQAKTLFMEGPHQTWNLVEYWIIVLEPGEHPTRLISNHY